MPIHRELRKLNSITIGLSKYQSKYQSNMSQRRRVLGRINEVLNEQRIQKDTADAALDATKFQVH